MGRPKKEPDTVENIIARIKRKMSKPGSVRRRAEALGRATGHPAEYILAMMLIETRTY